MHCRQGKTRSHREDAFFLYRYIHKHTQLPKQTDKQKDRAAGRAVYPSPNAKDERARLHRGTLSPRSSNAYFNSASQGKLCGIHVTVKTAQEHEHKQCFFSATFSNN